MEILAEPGHEGVAVAGPGEGVADGDVADVGDEEGFAAGEGFAGAADENGDDGDGGEGGREVGDP